MSVHTSAGDERHWAAWAGDVDRLSRLAKVMDDLIAPQREEAMDVMERALSATADADELARGRAAAAAELDSTLEVFEKELSIKHEGQPDAVLARIDPPTIRRAILSSPGRVGEGNRSQVDLSGEGCSLRVSGVDPKWVRMATGTIEAEIRRGVPNWHWLRSQTGLLVYAVIVGVPVFIVLLSIPDWIREDTGEPIHPVARVLISGVVGSMAGMLVGTLMNGLAQRLLPAFEILAPGQRGRGGRVLAFLGVQAFGLAVGLFWFLLGR